MPRLTIPAATTRAQDEGGALAHPAVGRDGLHSPVMDRDSTLIERSLDESLGALQATRSNPAVIEATDRFAELAAESVRRGGRLLVCGNGGSLSQATHFAEEWVGRFRNDRAALPAIALAEPATITCIANDFGFDQVFSRQVEAHARPGDLFVALSTSGRSPNVIEAARAARTAGIASVALTGPNGDLLANEVDVAIRIPTGRYADPVQECHLAILHAVVKQVESVLFPTQEDRAPLARSGATKAAPGESWLER
ncbi:MAG: phosphoheptose isomerase [Deltaproteobacteria bacterium]|nr:phosphoheptose isomerase [Deltaproteobacteria bacterium]